MSLIIVATRWDRQIRKALLPAWTFLGYAMNVSTIIIRIFPARTATIGNFTLIALIIIATLISLTWRYCQILKASLLVWTFLVVLTGSALRIPTIGVRIGPGHTAAIRYITATSLVAFINIASLTSPTILNIRPAFLPAWAFRILE